MKFHHIPLSIPGVAKDVDTQIHWWQEYKMVQPLWKSLTVSFKQVTQQLHS